MNKHKIIKSLFGIVLVLSLFIYTDVFAQNDNLSIDIDCSNAEDKTKCEKEANECLRGLQGTYTLTADLNDDGSELIIQETTQAAKKGKFNINVYDGNGKLIDSRNVAGGSEYRVPTGTNKGKTFDFTVKSLLTEENKYGDIDCSYKYQGTVDVGNYAPVISSYPNTSVQSGGICSLYKNDALTAKKAGKYSQLATGGIYSIPKLKEAASGTSINVDEKIQKMVPYCYQDNVEELYTDDQVLEFLSGAAQAISNMIVIEKNKVEITHDPAAVNLNSFDILNNKVNLTCDAFGTLDSTGTTYLSQNNVRKFYREEENNYQTVKYSYEEQTRNICHTKCSEEVTVTYGPPVSVKAGICFQYEVKIESKSTCTTVPDADYNSPPVEQKSDKCVVSAWCGYHSAQYVGQAGPNEEFDSCVNACDGGKYSQSCINKCYKKVYKTKKNNTKVNLELADAAVVRLADSNDYCNPTAYLKTHSITELENAVCAAYNNSSSHGYYTSNKTWVPTDTCHWSKYADVYTKGYDSTVGLNACQRTVRDDSIVINATGTQYNRSWEGGSTGNYFPLYTYYAGGFKGTSSEPCYDNCSFNFTNCGDTGSYYNGVAASSSKNKENYKKDLKAYNDAIAKCAAKAVCDTETTTYTMTVNNTKNEKYSCEIGSQDAKCQSFNDSYKKSGNGCVFNKVSQTSSLLATKDLATKGCTERNSQVLEEVSGTCAGVSGDGMSYRSVISFPGTWVNNKFGNPVYKEPEKLNRYKYKDGDFCLPYDTSYVNQGWWKWDQEGQRKAANLSYITKNGMSYATANDTLGTSYTRITGDSTKGNGVYNILAEAKKFGYFGWNIDVSCFYAYSEPDDNNGGGGPTIKTEGNENSQIRSVALDELFPATTGTSSSLKEVKPSKLNNKVNEDSTTNVEKVENEVTEEHSRTAGYNWSCDATNLSIKNYPIVPTILIDDIQTKKDSIYNNDINELDYEVSITPNQIKALRSYNKDHAFSYFDITKLHDDKENKGISFYKSTILRDSKYATLIKHPSDYTCNNLLNGSCYLYSEEITNNTTCPKLISLRNSK